MNEGEKNTVNVCQEKYSKNVLKKQHYEEVVTPTRRSTRIRKPKTSNEVGNKEVVEPNGILKIIELPKETLISENPTCNYQAIDGDCNKSNVVSSADNRLEASDTIFRIDNEDEESFKAMFDDIFEQRYSKTLQSLLPKKISNDSVKERKFFKRNNLETPTLNFSNYNGNLPAEDVSKVFKIISKPNPLSDITTESKSTSKPPLKTYSNKRKIVQKVNVVETFGLPDNPIASDMQHLMDDELDVTIQDANDITILEMEYITEPWIITTEGEDLFPFEEEIRKKSEPIHEPFQVNGSFLDFGDSFESFIEPTIFTSSPFNSRVSGNDSSVCTALKTATRSTKTVHRNKEIDIEAIKMNFKKILSRSDISESRERIIVKNTSSFSPKKNSMASKNSNISSANNDILFVDDSLTLDNEEFEFSDNLIVPNSNSLEGNDKNMATNSSIYNKRRSKITGKNLRSSMNSKVEKLEDLEKDKNVLKKQKLLSANEIRESVEDILPKKVSETDNLISNSKCNLQCHTGIKSDQQTNMKESDKITFECSCFHNKRILRSSFHNRNPRNEVRNLDENSTNEPSNEDRGKKLRDCEIKVCNTLNGITEKETEKSERKKLKSSSSHMKLERNKNMLETELLITNVKVKNKRRLRSANQDSLGQENSTNLCNNTAENPLRNKIVSDVTVTLEKCKINNDLAFSITDNSTNIIPNIQGRVHENKSLSPLKKCKKLVPEIIIILNPLDIFKYNEKLPENSKNSFYDMMSPTRRKLRSTKTLIDTSKAIGCSSLNESVINDNPVVILEEKKSEIEGKTDTDSDKKDSPNSKFDIKIKRKETKTNKTEDTNSNILYKNKVKSKSLSSIECLTNSSTDEIGTLKHHHSFGSEIGAKEDCQREKSKSTTYKEANIHISLNQNTNLVTPLNNEQNDPEKPNKITNKQIIETNSLEVQLSIIHLKSTNKDTNKSERCEVTEINSPKNTDSENNHKTEQSLQINIKKSPTTKKSETKDGNINLKCNVEVQSNLDLRNNCKWKESQKVCKQLEENENLKTDNLLSEDKNNISGTYNSKVEKNSLSDLFKKEEDKTLLSTSLTNKMSTKYLDDQAKVLNEDISRVSQKIMMVEYKSSDLSSDTQKVLNVVSDKIEIDPIKENNTSFEEIIEDNSNVDISGNGKTQEITDNDPHEQELENVLENKKEKINLPRQTTTSKFEKQTQDLTPCLVETISQKNADISLIECRSSETPSNKLIPDQERSTVSHVNKENKIVAGLKIETDSNILTISKNANDDKSERVEKHPGANARLKEKRRKLLGAKAFSTEESVKRNESMDCAKTKENLTTANHSCNTSLEHPLPIVRKRGRPRKSDIIANHQSAEKPTRGRPRGRPPRRKSLDDMDLLNRYKEFHKEKIKRSKSVARSMLEIRRKPNYRDRLESNKNWIDSYIKNNACEDDMDLLNRHKEFRKEKIKRSKSVTRSILEIRRKSNDGDRLESSKNWINSYLKNKDFEDEMDLLYRYKEFHNEKIKRSKSVSRSILEIRRKPNYRDILESNKNWIDSYIKNKDCEEDDMDLLNRDKEFHKEKIKRSKSVTRSMVEIRRKPNDRDRLESSKNWMESYLKNKDCEDDMDLLSRYKKYCIMKNKDVQNNHKIRTLKNDQSKNVKNYTGKINDLHADLPSDSSVKIREFSETDIKRSVNVKESQSIGNVASIGNIHPVEDFKVGDIAWAQIGSFPFWPCLFTKEPGKKYHKKIFQGKRFQRELYHVRFFGDKGRRAWIKKQQIMLYTNRDDLKLLQNKMKNENKPVSPAYVVKTAVLQKWKHAVEEAEQLKSKNVKEKLLFFVDMFSEIKSSKRKEPTPSNVVLKSPPVPVKRKSNEHNKTEEKCISPPNKESSDEKNPKKCKKKISSENETQNDAVRNKDEVVEDVNQVQQIEEIQQNENILNKLQLRRQIDEISEIDSKTSSDNITDSDISLNSMETQKVLYKRNNLFKGMSRDKVCQYCYKSGDVLKCRGRCNGSYHVSCSLKILLEKTPKKRKEKNTSPNNNVHDKKFGILRNKHTDKSSPSENSKCSPQDAKIDDINDKTALSEEEQVQIITVPSSVYNTPPRKTFPPDFKNMTLAEQIDYKMKEIMRKFESKTFYADSSSESNSEDHSGHQALAQIARINTPFININKNELVAIDNTRNDVTSISNDAHKLLIAKTFDKQIEKRITKKILCTKHVTADSDSLKSDSIQEEKSNADKDSFDGTEIDPKYFKCGFCISDLYPYCFICHLAVSKKGSNIRQKCSLYMCGRFYHPECLKMWPQTQWSLIQTTRHKDSDKDMDSFVCPLHVCHTCVSDDPRAATSRCSGDKIVKCLRCPSTYHSSNLCVPAGTAIFSSSQIVCPRHREKSKLYTINTTWCFLCSEGGNLICCETCPTSVHPECLPVSLTDDDKFICEDCESGRLPLYDEIVWVKLGKFRWWPAVILFPNEVPDNIKNMKHSIGEFVVKFFGTYDYYWVNRGRSFLFQEGDTGQCNSVKKKVDAAFNRAVEEAVVAHKLKKEFKLSQEVESITSLKPPPYIRIKVNKPVGNVRHLDLDLSSTNACECNPNKPHPCGPESDCLNRLLLTECNPEMCPAGTRCKNQSFEKREYPPLVPYKTQGRGWGLKTLAPIKKGQFVIEYVGELIDSEEYQRRIQKMHAQKEENYYFLTIDKDRMIDAGPKGNAARFMNHCCQPNCETQKWTVNGDTRVGLFATDDIPADTELTFNYMLECVGKEKKVCRCGAPNCSGFIGVKAKQDAEIKKPKKYVKKKVLAEAVVLPPCFVCGKMGLVIPCNNKVCNKTYHQDCLKITEQIEGNKFICPWHNCNTCSKRTIRCCVKCINSYCPSHSDGNVRYDNLLGFVCTTHDPMTPPSDVQPVFKRKKNDVITEETAVTSTTSDDVDDEDDWMPLLTRLKRMNSKAIPTVDSESDDSSLNITRSSTSLKQQSAVSDYESQDESAVSSATLTELDGQIVVKRKRGRPRKRDQGEKKIRLSNEQNIGITASSSLVDNKLRNHNNPELTSTHNSLKNR